MAKFTPITIMVIGITRVLRTRRARTRPMLMSDSSVWMALGHLSMVGVVILNSILPTRLPLALLEITGTLEVHSPAPWSSQAERHSHPEAAQSMSG